MATTTTTTQTTKASTNITCEGYIKAFPEESTCTHSRNGRRKLHWRYGFQRLLSWSWSLTVWTLGAAEGKEPIACRHARTAWRPLAMRLNYKDSVSTVSLADECWTIEQWHIMFVVIPAYIRHSRQAHSYHSRGYYVQERLLVSRSCLSSLFVRRALGLPLVTPVLLSFLSSSSVVVVNTVIVVFRLLLVLISSFPSSFSRHSRSSIVSFLFSCCRRQHRHCRCSSASSFQFFLFFFFL